MILQLTEISRKTKTLNERKTLFKYYIDKNVDFHQKFKLMYNRQSSPTPAKRTDGYYATCHPANE